MSQGLPELASHQRRGQCTGNQRRSFRDIKYNKCPDLSLKLSKPKQHLSWNFSVTCCTERLSHINIPPNVDDITQDS